MTYRMKRDRAIASDNTEFPFNPNKPAERRAAIAKAVERSNEHGKALEAQAGRPLTVRERATGKHDVPVEKSVPRSLKKEKDPDADFSSAIESVRNSSAHTPQQKQIRDARIAALERVASKREEQRIAADLAAEHFSNPDTVAFIASAESMQDSAMRDPATPPSMLRAIGNLVHIARTQVGLTKAGYLAMLSGMGLAKPDRASAAKENGLNEDVTGRLANQDFTPPGEPTND